MSMNLDPTNPTAKLLSKKELASYLGVSKSTIERLVRGRKIPFYRIGGSVRFSIDEVMAYIQKNRVEVIDAENL